MNDPSSGYAELHCLSNFTFLRGASHPEELVERACQLGYGALALTDECSVAGVVRALLQVKREKERGRHLKLIVGAEFRLTCGMRFVALVPHRQGYGRLCRLITRGRRVAEKGSYTLERMDVQALLEQCLILWLPGAMPNADEARWLAERFPGDVWIATELLCDGDDRERLARLQRLGRELGLPLVASGDVHMHVRSRRHLQDVLTAIRHTVPLAEAGWRLFPNGERHLRELARLRRLYPPELLAETLAIAERCTFSLEELRYEYPRELVPSGETPQSHLRKLVEEGARKRWPQGVTERTRATIEHELALISELKYEPYFLTVHDIVRYAREEKHILCQGRGSAANSVVCYCLGVTSLDPQRVEACMLMERFISRERNEPPDIDIDFEHERREEVIQYVYRKYGRERAALAATVIMYRPRSALRDVGKAFGLDPLQVARLAKTMQWWDGSTIDDQRVREAGIDPRSPVLMRVLAIANELVGFPRHLSQHVGGFVMSEGRLDELVPIENAAMEDRTVVQWDKDDLDDLGLMKVDLLGLGMLTALRRAFDLVNDYWAPTGKYHKRWTLGELPPEDPRVYEMISRADTVGVFQIESRAQMSMLPRLQPRKYYDLVIEVAIVRPGPIQGDMVHPYLRRRCGEEPVTFPSEEVRKVLGRTLGVPIFQEQVMQLAMVAAGFTGGEADALRRAMAAWKRRGGLEPFKEKLISGMVARNYDREFAERIFNQILGFGEYGFPESHAASFALLVYDSSWLKCYEPAAFTCALLNSLPMGFYAPAQLVRDAREHGVEVRPVRIEASELESTLERREQDGQPALRLGMKLVKGLSEEGAKRIVKARAQRPFASVQDLAERAALDRADLEALAGAGALASLSGNRHLAFWEVAGTEKPMPLAPRGQRAADDEEGRPLLTAPTPWQTVLADYGSTGLTLGPHPLALLRERLARENILRAQDLRETPNGRKVKTAGIVLLRQHPSSANGVIFVTIEDETGAINLIVWSSVADAQRRPLLESRLLEVHGELQHQHGVMHVIAERLIDRSSLIGELLARSRDFH
ncbi:MAG TPA: error-prone DNA polymerase [Steroidobacteraceae bacterium]|nr:error-prone DNA polymerase [Steroidobacteraceae bacterium]